jgi:hypothetical protein
VDSRKTRTQTVVFVENPATAGFRSLENSLSVLATVHTVLTKSV